MVESESIRIVSEGINNYFIISKLQGHYNHLKVSRLFIKIYIHIYVHDKIYRFIYNF